MGRTIFLACLLCLTTQGLAISDDKFIKKYAMMKVSKLRAVEKKCKN